MLWRNAHPTPRVRQTKNRDFRIVFLPVLLEGLPTPQCSCDKMFTEDELGSFVASCIYAEVDRIVRDLNIFSFSFGSFSPCRIDCLVFNEGGDVFDAFKIGRAHV